VERAESHAVVEELLDLMEGGFALATILLARLLLVPSLVTTSTMRVAALPKFANVHKQTPFSFLLAHDVGE